ncbi:MAG: hypothetical protein JNK72_25000 [Myxococcales bacterium]|nr:hypothetical protein [Myxococcales bacterium]
MLTAIATEDGFGVAFAGGFGGPFVVPFSHPFDAGFARGFHLPSGRGLAGASRRPWRSPSTPPRAPREGANVAD